MSDTIPHFDAIVKFWQRQFKPCFLRRSEQFPTLFRCSVEPRSLTIP